MSTHTPAHNSGGGPDAAGVVSIVFGVLATLAALSVCLGFLGLPLALVGLAALAFVTRPCRVAVLLNGFAFLVSAAEIAVFVFLLTCQPLPQWLGTSPMPAAGPGGWGFGTGTGTEEKDHSRARARVRQWEAAGGAPLVRPAGRAAGFAEYDLVLQRLMLLEDRGASDAKMDAWLQEYQRRRQAQGEGPPDVAADLDACRRLADEVDRRIRN